jgi:hypothetical protein
MLQELQLSWRVQALSLHGTIVLRNYTDRTQLGDSLPTSHHPSPSNSMVEDHKDALIPWTKLQPKSQATSASLATSSRTRRAKINNAKKIVQRNETAACGEPMSLELVQESQRPKRGSRVVRGEQNTKWQLLDM